MTRPDAPLRTPGPPATRYSPRAPYAARDLDASASTIEEVQLPSGMIPWHRGGHGDPWNHVEAAMALTATGRTPAAERAYAWLLATQRPDGAWHAYYAHDGSVEAPELDTNAVAYVAAGVRHHFLTTGDRGFLEQMWPVVEAALEWVLARQRRGGEVAWAVGPDGRPGADALLAASSSVCTSLVAAIGCAGDLGIERPAWVRAARRLADAVAHRPEAFAPKGEFAMDWYYPVLCGALAGTAARDRMESAWRRWVVDGRGVRCRSDGTWVTTAETAECAIACIRLDWRGRSSDLLEWTWAHRDADGRFATGTVQPGGAEFPPGERTTYSAAAVVLAADLLAGSPATSSVLTAPLPASRRAGEHGG